MALHLADTQFASPFSIGLKHHPPVTLSAYAASICPGYHLRSSHVATRVER
jgi:hypothetical protein